MGLLFGNKSKISNFLTLKSDEYYIQKIDTIDNVINSKINYLKSSGIDTILVYKKIYFGDEFTKDNCTQIDSLGNNIIKCAIFWKKDKKSFGCLIDCKNETITKVTPNDIFIDEKYFYKKEERNYKSGLDYLPPISGYQILWEITYLSNGKKLKFNINEQLIEKNEISRIFRKEFPATKYYWKKIKLIEKTIDFWRLAK